MVSVATELPTDLRDDPAVVSVVAAIDAMLAPLFDLVDNLDTHLDAHTAPAGIVDWLATIVGAYSDRPPSLDQRRRLVAAAHEISRWWGTKRGLAALVRADTGTEPEIVEDFSGPRPRVLVRLSGVDSADRQRLRALVASAVPVHVQGEVEIR
ncbi:phage tail protein [Actinocrispum wychmicini]|uniref:Phage tail-like protein n=1 Tax=Actinocrispum wychmicini TaxID=1213861 RepID=A0A4R2JPC5_9PSEU|nr:phage tail protein [Actinocrispum wychmicini]TCO60612.1 phage tail-like protein [Actinocrispum wychmicini]